MEAFDLGMFPHSVYLLTLNDGVDATASTAEDFTPGPTPLPCRIRFTKTRQVLGTGDREVSTTEAYLAFPADPGAVKGSRFRAATGGLLFRVLAPCRARDGDGALYVANCEVID